MSDQSPAESGQDQMLDGGCGCGGVRYRLAAAPLFVHCCHCRWCQRETGSAFALNALIESDRVTLLNGDPEVVNTPSLSGKGQKIWRCPECRVAVWSNYAMAVGDLLVAGPVSIGSESNLHPVRGPSRFLVSSRIGRQTRLPGAISVHHVDISVAVSVGIEGDLGAVG